MKFHNLQKKSQIVDYLTAVRKGLGDDQGLFFPKTITALSNVNHLLTLPSKQRNFEILKPFVKGNLTDEQLRNIIQSTFKFPAKLVSISQKIKCLELFHGPTLAFKDFGANFMANCLKCFSDGNKITILTATSGDTGAAVAHAFYEIKNIDVVILYPRGKISKLQEKMFTTLGKNIRAVAINGTFDDCQSLAKQSFSDHELVQKIGLNSANSINISRLLAQVCYYFDAVAQLPSDQRDNIVISVPSGNFGNLTAGIIAQRLGLSIKRFVATTNVNDTVPRYLATGDWLPKETIPTLSNAMDVSRPNNWPRIEYLIETKQFDKNDLQGSAVSEKETVLSLKSLKALNYISEPHASIAYEGLVNSLAKNEMGIFLGTAHPAKFKGAVDRILNLNIELPTELATCSAKPDLSIEMENSFDKLRSFLVR